MIRIYNFARGARGMRVMWVCEEMGMPYEVENIPFPVTSAYRAINPLGTMPFLQDDAAGVGMNESTAMMLYVAQTYGPTPLLPEKDDPQLASVLQLTTFGEATFGAGLNPLMEAHFGAPEADKRNWSVVNLEKRMEQALQYLIDKLGDRQFLVGSDLTLADISICTALGIWRGALGKTVPDKLAAYRAHLAQRAAYQRALKRCAG